MPFPTSLLPDIIIFLRWQIFVCYEIFVRFLIACGQLYVLARAFRTVTLPHGYIILRNGLNPMPNLRHLWSDCSFKNWHRMLVMVDQGQSIIHLSTAHHALHARIVWSLRIVHLWSRPELCLTSRDFSLAWQQLRLWEDSWCFGQLLKLETFVPQFGIHGWSLPGLC